MNTDNPYLLSAAGIAELKTYLEGPADRAATLAGNWPITVAEIASRAEFERDIPGMMERGRQVGEFFPRLCDQLDALADQLGDFLEPPRGNELLLKRSEVKPGEFQLQNWHADGPVLLHTGPLPENRELCSAVNLGWLYGSGVNFEPRDIFFHATFELPPKFAARVTAAFDKNIFAAVNAPDGKVFRELNKPGLEAWLTENAAINTSPRGFIIAFPSCIPHSSTPPDKNTLRTVAVAPMRRKRAAQVSSAPG